MGGELAGRVAIITGAAGGIGRATAELFVEQGARVVLADIDAEGGRDAATSLGKAALFAPTDVSRPDSVQEAIDRAVSEFGGLDIMFNNAGIPGAMAKGFLDDPFDDFESVMAVNLRGVMLGCQRAARAMRERGGGSIVNTASLAGLKAGGGVWSYRAAKAAVIHLTRCLAIELAGLGIRVNCIAPGHIATAMTSYDQGPVIEFMQPLQRRGASRDVAEAALFLAGDRSAQVTGLIVPVDGGTNVGPPPGPFREFLRARAADAKE